MKFLSLAVFSILCSVGFCQDKIREDIDNTILKREAEAHLLFLAADEMKGRDAGSAELDIAANYIRTQFRMYNVPPAPGASDYFQPVGLLRSSPASAAVLNIGKDEFSLKDNLLLLEGGSIQWEGDMVYVGYGAPDELSRMDLKGKMVLALAGSRDADNINKVYGASREKFSHLKKMGATGLVEILAFPQVPWSSLQNSFNKDRWGIEEGNSKTPFIWIKPKNLKELSFSQGEKVIAKIAVDVRDPVAVPGKNVAGYIEGSDPVLKDEFVIITAHYDHIGVDRQSHKGDTIFNGARDNATGTVALIQTAKFLSANRPKRSVLLVAVTSEEKGMLGSKWYVKHPLVPLKKHVLSLNCDGVGYNDKSRVTSISLGRTNMDDLLTTAAKSFDFSLGGDPDPREGFYERSDQLSFAKEGIPALKLQPGLAKMDEDIFKYYHRQADEVSSLDLDYITRFYKTFVYAVYLITNDSRKPMWVKGDKFEEAYRNLYK